MIQGAVQLQWPAVRCKLLPSAASLRHRVVGRASKPTVTRVYSCRHSPCSTGKSPPTFLRPTTSTSTRSTTCGCQLQMKSPKRSHPHVIGASMYLRSPHCQLSRSPLRCPSQVVRFASGAHFSGDSDSKGTEVRRSRKTRSGQLRRPNRVIGGGQGENGQRDRKSRETAFALDSEGLEDFESDHGHDKIDIHSTEGALQLSLPTDEELTALLHKSGQKTANILQHPRYDDSDISDLNEIDNQYFSEAAQVKGQLNLASPNHTETACEEPSSTLDVNGGNVFDQQYFGKREGGATNPPLTPKGNVDRSKFLARHWRKKTQPVYMDTSTPEGHYKEVEYGLKTQKTLKEFDKHLGKMFEDVGQDKSVSLQSLFQHEPHEVATEFQKLDDGNEHEEVTFINEMQVGERQIRRIPSGPLKAKLDAERAVKEGQDELRIGSHNLADLEPEIIKAMKAVRHSKRSSQPKGKGPKGHKVFGTPDPALPVADVSCSGCGAQFQAQEPSQPGYLPSEKYSELLDDDRLENAVCQRCWYLSHHQTALDVSVKETDYSDIIGQIRRKAALVVVLVDLLDFPCSLIPNLKTMVGERKPMIIVGNKADLLPVDSADCHKRISKQLLQACVDAGVCNHDNTKHVSIISAKSGYGIEPLISVMQQKWGTNGDVYLIGTANVGKSSLFNRLLHSDYAKAKAAWLISKATISRWPGTTLNLLRFPIVKPTSDKIALREERLSAERKKVEAEKQRSKMQRNESEDLDPEAYVKGTVGRSYEIKMDNGEEKELDKRDDPFAISLSYRDTPVAGQTPKRLAKDTLPFPFKPEEFKLGRWFYDTPGLIQDQQIVTKLTVDELKVLLPNKVILPKTLVLKPGNTIFLGGMGRLDYLEGHKAAFFTIFASKTMPVRVMSTSKADEDYEAKAKDNHLKVPLGGIERLQTLPALQPVDMTVHGEGWKCSAADVLFSSAGWASVTAASGMEVHLRAYTPGGYGCMLRSPSLLPYIVNLRGDRVAKKSPFFYVDKQKLTRFL